MGCFDQGPFTGNTSVSFLDPRAAEDPGVGVTLPIRMMNQRLWNSFNGFQFVENFRPPMPSSDPDSSQADSVSELLKQAAATAYCRPALRTLGSGLPADDPVLASALRQAAEMRDAKSFSHLYVAALYAGRRIAAEVLELGAALLPEAMLLLHTALRLEGDVAKSLAVAVRSGRMSDERDAISLVAGWLDYERREVTAPPEFLALTRKICREAVRMERNFIRILLDPVATLSGDPVLAAILHIETSGDDASRQILEQARKNATGPGWDASIPSRPVVETILGSGATLKRAIPKAGRNDPCPCGSGKKFKQCCDGKISTGDQYEVGGVTLSDAVSHPELILTTRRICEMRSHELYALDSKLLIPKLAEMVAVRLTRFHEFSRAIEVLQVIGREAVSENALDEIAFELLEAREIGALRWLLEWVPESVFVSFEMEVFLATPAERIRLLLEKASEAFEAARSGDTSTAEVLFSDLGYGALIADPALGVVVARGVLPVCGWVNQPTLIEDIEDARDILGLDDDEAGYEIVDATARASLDEARHAIDIEKVRVETSSRVGKRDAEIQRLKAQIDSMQETLTEREEAIERAIVLPNEKPSSRAAVPAPPDSAETRELREHLRRLKENLKVEHDERNRAIRDLRAARDQLRRTTREKPENQEPEKPTVRDPDTDDSAGAAVEWEPQSLRIPEYAAAFRESLRHQPRQVSAAALTLAGRLAGGDPSAWKTVRALKLRPGTLRARVAGDYRLLFEIAPGDTLRLVDFILRRDLDRWLAAAGR